MSPAEAARLRECWDRLFSVNHALHEAGDAFGLAAGAEDIARAERALGFALPEEIKATSGIYDGVNDAWKDCDFHRLEDLAHHLERCRDEAAQCPPFRCGAGVLPPQFGAQLIPFASGPDDTAYCLDYNPGEGGVAGQVTAVCLDDASARVAAASYLEFLERGVRRREGRLARARARGDQDAGEEGGLKGCLWGGGMMLVWGAIMLPMLVIGPLKRLLMPRRLGRWLAARRQRRAQARAQAPEPPRRAHAPRTRAPAAPGSITALWHEIEDLNRALGYDVDEQFFPGASAQELAELERALGRALPAELRELFSACAACDEPWSDDTRGYGGYVVQGLPAVAENMRAALEHRQKFRLFPGTRAPLPGAGLIPIEGGNPCLCYDLNPGAGGAVGQIVDVDLMQGACRVVAPSLRAWLEQGIAKLRAASPGVV